MPAPVNSQSTTNDNIGPTTFEKVSQLDSSLKEALISFKKHIAEETSNLKCPQDDDFLLRFLRARNLDVGRAFELLENYFRFKEDKSFKRFYPSALHQPREQRIFAALNATDNQGRAVIMSRLSKWKPTSCSSKDLVTYGLLLVEELLESVAVQENGFVFVVDLEGFSFSHASAVSYSAMKMGASACTGNFPIKVKGIYFINQSAFFGAVFAVFSLFLSEKLKSRVKFFGHAYNELHEFIDEGVLPKRYGGILSDEDAFDSNLDARLLEKDDSFKERMLYGYTNHTI